MSYNSSNAVMLSTCRRIPTMQMYVYVLNIVCFFFYVLFTIAFVLSSTFINSMARSFSKWSGEIVKKRHRSCMEKWRLEKRDKRGIKCIPCPLLKCSPVNRQWYLCCRLDHRVCQNSMAFLVLVSGKTIFHSIIINYLGYDKWTQSVAFEPMVFELYILRNWLVQILSN